MELPVILQPSWISLFQFPRNGKKISPYIEGPYVLYMCALNFIQEVFYILFFFGKPLIYLTNIQRLDFKSCAEQMTARG